MYILEHCSSIKGKGLQGEFVYSWLGADLVLLPVDSTDYKDIQEYNSGLRNKTFKVKDLLEGGVYKDKQQKLWIYMGKYEKWDRLIVKKYKHSWRNSDEDIELERIAYSKGEFHYFYKLDSLECDTLKYLSAPKKLKSVTGLFIDYIGIYPNYASLHEQMWIQEESLSGYLFECKDENSRYKKVKLEKMTENDFFLGANFHYSTSNGFTCKTIYINSNKIVNGNCVRGRDISYSPHSNSYYYWGVKSNNLNSYIESDEPYKAIYL